MPPLFAIRLFFLVVCFVKEKRCHADAPGTCLQLDSLHRRSLVKSHLKCFKRRFNERNVFRGSLSVSSVTLVDRAKGAGDAAARWMRGARVKRRGSSHPSGTTAGSPRHTWPPRPPYDLALFSLSLSFTGCIPFGRPLGPKRSPFAFYVASSPLGAFRHLPAQPARVRLHGSETALVSPRSFRDNERLRVMSTYRPRGATRLQLPSIQ